MTGSPRPYLVFFRAGAASLHPRLIAQEPDRNWDCCVSWYITPRPESLAEYYEDAGTNKFDAFVAFYSKAIAASRYRYVLIVDDDIDFQRGDISRLFALCDEYNLYLAQPSLRWGTHANHDVTLHNPVCVIRRARFIEVMAPCFSREALERLLPTFGLSRSTWGIDYAWASLLAGEGRIAIVDAIQVAHTKAVSLDGGAFYLKLKASGIDPFAEYRHIKETYPRFGSLGTERSGHRLVFLLPDFLGRLVVPLFEGIKKRVHRARRWRA
ncbi:MAG: hypothetical protein NTW45_12755 [Rhodocyclales bacterium]|nr:hypothetical protein [Rhodocyclales bacterium]